MQFLSARRGTLDIDLGIAKFESARKRMLDAWMDLIPPGAVGEDHPRWVQLCAMIPIFLHQSIIF